MGNLQKFDELKFFADVKKRPGVYLGYPSLLSLRDQLFGMTYAFSFYSDETPLQYFDAFVEWYHREKLDDKNGYACWWNNLLYHSGNNDRLAFDMFFAVFERFLHEVHHISLPSE